jgi:hypothetical protein
MAISVDIKAISQLTQEAVRRMDDLKRELLSLPTQQLHAISRGITDISKAAGQSAREVKAVSRQLVADRLSDERQLAQQQRSIQTAYIRETKQEAVAAERQLVKEKIDIERTYAKEKQQQDRASIRERLQLERQLVRERADIEKSADRDIKAQKQHSHQLDLLKGPGGGMGGFGGNGIMSALSALGGMGGGLGRIASLLGSGLGIGAGAGVGAAVVGSIVSDALGRNQERQESTANALSIVNLEAATDDQGKRRQSRTVQERMDQARRLTNASRLIEANTGKTISSADVMGSVHSMITNASLTAEEAISFIEKNPGVFSRLAKSGLSGPAMGATLYQAKILEKSGMSQEQALGTAIATYENSPRMDPEDIKYAAPRVAMAKDRFKGAGIKTVDTAELQVLSLLSTAAGKGVSARETATGLDYLWTFGAQHKELFKPAVDPKTGLSSHQDAGTYLATVASRYRGADGEFDVVKAKADNMSGTAMKSLQQLWGILGNPEGLQEFQKKTAQFVSGDVGRATVEESNAAYEAEKNTPAARAAQLKMQEELATADSASRLGTALQGLYETVSPTKTASIKGVLDGVAGYVERFTKIINTVSQEFQKLMELQYFAYIIKALSISMTFAYEAANLFPKYLMFVLKAITWAMKELGSELSYIADYVLKLFGSSLQGATDLFKNIVDALSKTLEEIPSLIKKLVSDYNPFGDGTPDGDVLRTKPAKPAQPAAAATAPRGHITIGTVNVGNIRTQGEPK